MFTLILSQFGPFYFGPSYLAVAITPFKVIQGHRFRYQSKAHMQRLISKYYYLLSCTIFKLSPIVGQIFASDMGVPHFNTLAGGDPLRISG